MKPFLDFDYQENKLYEQAYTEYDNVVRMSRKERYRGRSLRATYRADTTKIYCL